MEQFLELDFVLKIVVRSLLAVIIGSLIGSEREKHGRAAGMRTHILVCLGSALTSMISLYAAQFLGNQGDITRISAQVVSGIGFLGAGMIILKDNNVITGLTTAAGVWTSSVIGIALGFGFYLGAFVVTLFFLLAIIIFARFKRTQKSADVIYLEIDNMYEANNIIASIKDVLKMRFTHHFTAPKSVHQNNLGITLVLENKLKVEVTDLLKIKGIVFVEEE